ncbi:MAG TPA: GGDEF domain-containing protein [Candidatus Dormibacteraeota bacterium]|jgi:diguanylate cyclase (GGDEF)-like protein|nr:GGDEF domain-containing protein [Candidatus Dormibacteraeota bacterium]
MAADSRQAARAVAAVAKVGAVLSVDTGGLIETCVQATGDSVPEYFEIIEKSGEKVGAISAGLATMFLSAVQTEGDLLLYEFWDAMRAMGRRRCAQGVSLDTLLEVVSIHRQVVLAAVEAALGTGAGSEQALLTAQRRMEAAMEKHTLSLTRGYLDGMQERYQEQQGVLRALISVAGAMNRSLEVRDVAETGLSETLSATGMESGCLWLPGATGRDLVLAYSSGLTWEEDRALRESPRHPGGDDLIGRAATFEGSVRGSFSLVPQGAQDWHALAVALRFKGELTGVLSVATRANRQFTPTEMSFVGAIADHMAVALDRAYQHRREARTDLLTGIANRGEFERAIQREVASAERHKHPLSLLLLDLDELKLINDRHGHQAGDEAIRAVADALRKTVRASDTCARLGGDEFAVAMPQADEGQTFEVAGRIRENLAQSSASWADTPLSVSIGVVGWELGLDAPRMYQLADARLYKDKQRQHSGRRRRVIPNIADQDQGSLFQIDPGNAEPA